jgi:hypothetical protein
VQGRTRFLLEVYGFKYNRADHEQMFALAKQEGCDGVVVSEDGCYNSGNPGWKDLARFNERFRQ